VNIVVVSLEREEGDYGTVVLTLAILAKIVSNIGWFIMWVQGIEVRARICKPFKEPRNRFPALRAGRYNNPTCRTGPPGYIVLGAHELRARRTMCKSVFFFIKI
jgi:hypothetical protein